MGLKQHKIQPIVYWEMNSYLNIDLYRVSALIFMALLKSVVDGNTFFYSHNSASVWTGHIVSL